MEKRKSFAAAKNAEAARAQLLKQITRADALAAGKASADAAAAHSKRVAERGEGRGAPEGVPGRDGVRALPRASRRACGTRPRRLPLLSNARGSGRRGTFSEARVVS